MIGYIQAINGVDEEHLEEVMTVAAEMGRVELNAYSTGEEIYLLEGSHRIEAAFRLGLPVTLKLREWDEEVVCDLEDVAIDGTATAGAIIDYVHWSTAGKIYTPDQFASIEIIERGM